MSETYWWHTYGPFKLWNQCPTRPDPGEVLLFYLAKREIPPEEHVSFLSNLLELQKSMTYTILKGDGLDSISRCRLLVQALKIHPPLLGIDAKFYPIERHGYWWQDCGYSFDADAQGYPLIGQVIAYLRVHRLSMGGGSVKGWSQEDLGEATGLKKETIYRMEHDRNPLILEHMSRRSIVASALGTLAGDQESLLYQLFGLDPQAYGIPVSAQDVVLEVHDVPERLTDEILDEYQRTLARFFTEYYTGHAQDLVAEAHAWLRRLETLCERASTTAELVRLLALKSGYHQRVSCIAREQQKAEQVAFHTAMSVRDLLQTAQKVTPPELLQQHTLIQIFLALDAFSAGDYRQAIDFALEALEKSRQIRSHPNRDRLAALYQQLLNTEARNNPYCSYFGVKLRTWHHGA